MTTKNGFTLEIIPTQPLRDLIMRRGMTYTEVGKMYVERFGKQKARLRGNHDTKRTMERILDRRYTDIYRADAICVLFGLNPYLVYGDLWWEPLVINCGIAEYEEKLKRKKVSA